MNKSTPKIITKQNIKSFCYNNIAHLIAYLVVGLFGSSITTWLFTEFEGLGIKEQWVSLILSLLISVISWGILVGSIMLIDFFFKTKKALMSKLADFKEHQNTQEKLSKEQYMKDCQKKNTIYQTVEKVVIKEVHVPTNVEILINKIKNEKDHDKKVQLYKQLKKEVGI